MESSIAKGFSSVSSRLKELWHHSSDFSCRPSPFFMLDEVDAALDNLNVAKVARFIRSKSCEGARNNQDADIGIGFQSIVISLKDSFYDKAKGLVGVYRDSEIGCSRTLTFDLSKYRES